MRVHAGGRDLTVEVERTAAGCLVRAGGVTRYADLVRAAGGWSLLLHEADPRAGGAARSYEVTIDRRPGGAALVVVNGRSVPVMLTRVHAASRRGAAAAGDGRQVIVAPMAGRVVKVLVQSGDVVTARQGLVVVEAMKMQNELRAERDGLVADVRVVEGMPVEAGAVLVVVEARRGEV